MAIKALVDRTLPAARMLHVVHLPVYSENAYQPMLMDAQRKLGWRVTDGGGGGNFFRTAIRRWKADILHFHWLHPYLLRSSAIASWARGLRFVAEIAMLRRAGTRIVWTVHNLENHHGQHGAIELSLTRIFVRQIDLLISHGEYAIAAAVERFRVPGETPKLAVRLPNYSARYSTELSQDQCREIWNTRSTGTIIGFLGRVEPYKQVVELIIAFRAVAGFNDQLLIGGRTSSTEYAAEVQAAIAGDSRIRFQNSYIPEDQIASFMHAVDIVACTSKGILTSSSVALAMSFGKPAIAPAEGCIPEELGNTGFLYPATAKGLEYAIREAIKQKFKCVKLGHAAKKRADEAAPDRIAHQIVEQYEAILSGGPQKRNQLT